MTGATHTSTTTLRPAGGRAARVVVWTVVVLLLLVGLTCVGIWIPGLDILFFLLVGWGFFLGRVGPQLEVRWDLVASVAVYVAALVVGSHLFLGWLYRESGRRDRVPPVPTDPAALPAARRWKWRWTLAGFALIGLMFAAGTATIGVVHQVSWLARSPEPIYRRGRDRPNRIKCAANLRTIGQGLLMYAQDHGGKYPDDFGTVLRDADITSEVFVCPSSNDERATGHTPAEIAAHLSEPGHCSYLYFGKGLTHPAPPRRVLAVERPGHHDAGGLNVLFGDGSVEWVQGEAADALLLELGFERVEPGDADADRE